MSIRSRFLPTAAVLASLLALFVAGCDNPTSIDGPPEVTPPTTPGGPRAVGTVEITLTGIGTPQMSATASGQSTASGEGPRRVLTGVSGTGGAMQMEAVARGSFTRGVRGAGGERLIWATFRVRNAQGDGTAYGVARSNVTFLAASNGVTIPGTPISALNRFDGTAADPAIASALRPTGAVTQNPATGGESASSPDVLQVLTEAEVDAVTPPAGVSDIFPYGFMVRNTSGGRSLPANPAADQFDGLLTVAVRVPLQATPSDDPFSMTFLFAVVEDSETRITQSLEEQTPAGQAAFEARAASIGASGVTILPGGAYAGAIPQRQICKVRLAGTEASPTLTMFSGAPCTRSDQYDAIGNLTLTYDNAITGHLLANDEDPDAQPVSALAETVASTNGGTATIAMDGTFTYRSPAGFTGTDTFTYQVTDGAQITAGTATIDVPTRVWYVRNTALGGDGRDVSPMNNLSSAIAAASENETIYVLYEDINDLEAGVTLKNGQLIVGQGISADVTTTLNGISHTLLAAGSTPSIGRNTTPGATLTLATNNTIRGVNLTSASGAAVVGSSFGTLTIDEDVSIFANGGPALDLTNGTLNGSTIANLSSTGSTTTGLNLSGVAGTLWTTGGSITTGAGATAAVNVSGGSADISLAANLSNTAGRLVSVTGRTGGNVEFSGSLNGSGGTGTGILVQGNAGSGADAVTFSGASKTISTGANAAVTITSNAVPVNFTNGALNITTTTGNGFVLSGSAQPVSLAGMDVSTTSGTGIVATGLGGALVLTGAGNDVTATAGKVLDITDRNLNLTFATLSSSGSATQGIRLGSTSGTITVGTTTVSGSAGIGIDINSHGGTITSTNTSLTNTGARAVSIVSIVSGTFNLGALNINNAATNQTGLYASSGGTVNTTSGALHGGSAAAVDVDNTALGVTLTSATSIGGSAPGIDLRTTTGSFTVAGSGTAGSGGSITGKTGADGSDQGNGIYLSSAQNVSLNWMGFSGHQNNGLYGTGVRGLTLNKVRFTGTHGTSASGTFNESAVQLVDIGGAVRMTNSRFDGGALNAVRLANLGGAAPALDSLVFENDTIEHMQGSTSDVRGTALLVDVNGGTADLRIRNSRFTYWWGNAVHVLIYGSASGTTRITGNTAHQTSGALAGAGGIWLAGGNHAYLIANNSIRSTNGTAISADRVGTGTLMQGTIENNMIGQSGVANSGSTVGSGIFISHHGPGTTTHRVRNNTIRQIGGNAAISTNTGDATGFGGSGTIHATITGNDIRETAAPATVRWGLLITHGVQSGSGVPGGINDTDVGCYEVSGNVVQNFNTGAAAGRVDAVRVNQRFGTTSYWPGYTGAATGSASTTDMANYLVGRNTIASATNANSSTGGFNNTSPPGSACPVPSL